MSTEVGTMVLIPALNAESTIGEIVAGCLKHTDSVVVVDDGSTDGTRRESERAGATVLRHPENRRKGAALRTGFNYATMKGVETVITLDADGQHLPADIPKFIEAYHSAQADLVIGSRAHLFGEMQPRRRRANRFSSASISWAAGAKIDDSQSGYRLYSARLIEKVKFTSNGFDAESEIIVRAGRSGMKIIMIPIDLAFADGVRTSHYKAVGDTLQIAWTVFKTRFFV